ncbi:BfmA/BtgA family mobilization protein [Spirosoma flavum]|uniref:BfmA/BtgA family mobilization protein n=1 Tax=Spirosoma flavum TaxID=2048557 RepID=A0ABW6ATN7_9BACT
MARNYKSIDVSLETHEQLSKLAESYGLTNKALVEAMLQYFKATKADPRDPKNDNPTDAIKALDRRLISFIRQQEKEQLRPIRDDLKILLSFVQDELPKTLRQSQMRTIGGALKAELQTEQFRQVYLDMIEKTKNKST